MVIKNKATNPLLMVNISTIYPTQFFGVVLSLKNTISCNLVFLFKIYSNLSELKIYIVFNENKCLAKCNFFVLYIMIGTQIDFRVYCKKKHISIIPYEVFQKLQLNSEKKLMQFDILVIS